MIGIRVMLVPIENMIHVGYISHNAPYARADSADPPVLNALTNPNIAPLLS